MHKTRATPWRHIGLSLGAALLLPLAPAAQAAIVSGTLSFTATGLPIDPIVGTVRFSFDNTATFFNAPDGATRNGALVEVTVLDSPLVGLWTPVLTYVKSGTIGGVPVADLMSIGHVLNGTQTIAGTDDWRIAFDDISTAPRFREFTYTEAGSPGLVLQTFAGSAAAVPEPASLWLAALGAAGLLLQGRRGRRTREAPRALGAGNAYTTP